MIAPMSRHSARFRRDHSGWYSSGHVTSQCTVQKGPQRLVFFRPWLSSVDKRELARMPSVSTQSADSTNSRPALFYNVHAHVHEKREKITTKCIGKDKQSLGRGLLEGLCQHFYSGESGVCRMAGAQSTVLLSAIQAARELR